MLARAVFLQNMAQSLLRKLRRLRSLEGDLGNRPPCTLRSTSKHQPWLRPRAMTQGATQAELCPPRACTLPALKYRVLLSILTTWKMTTWSPTLGHIPPYLSFYHTDIWHKYFAPSILKCFIPPGSSCWKPKPGSSSLTYRRRTSRQC